MVARTDALTRAPRASWDEREAAAVERSRQVLADIRSGGALDLARLSVAVRELRNLIQSSGAASAAEEPAASPPSAPLV